MIPLRIPLVLAILSAVPAILAAVLLILPAVPLSPVSVLSFVALLRLRSFPFLWPVALLATVLTLAPVATLTLILALIASLPPIPVRAPAGLLSSPAVLLSAAILRLLSPNPSTVFAVAPIGAGRRPSATLAPFLLPQPEHLVPALPEPAGAAAPQIAELRRLAAILHVARSHGTLAPLDDEPRAKGRSTVDR